VPVGRLLARHRGRAYGWSYGHIVVFASVAGTGAGLHVAATFIAGEARIDAVAAVLTVVIPVLVYELMLLALYLLLLRSTDPLHLWAFATAALVLAGAVVAVASGASIGIGLLLVAGSPALVIVLYETVGYRNEAAALERQALE
jgi:low temperature requirement A protein (LtrA)